MSPASSSGDRRRFTVVTACLPERSEHLVDAAASVERARQEISPLELEWIVAVDGPGDLRAKVDADTVIHLASRSGVSAARNTALGVARGDLVVPLDADDTLVVDGLVQAHNVLKADSIGWVGANRILLGTEERTPHWHGPRSWRPGEFAEQWTAPLQFHPNSFVSRRDLVLRCGGWPALPANEDLLLVMLMSELAEGASVEGVLTEYRVWDGQEVASSSYPENKRAAFLFIEQCLNAARRERGRSEVSHPRPGGAYGVMSRERAG